MLALLIQPALLSHAQRYKQRSLGASILVTSLLTISIEITHVQAVVNSQWCTEFLYGVVWNYIALCIICFYFREFQSKYSSLLCGLGYPSLVTGTPDYTWLTSSQRDVLSKLRSYWLPRFMIAKPTRRCVVRLWTVLLWVTCPGFAYSKSAYRHSSAGSLVVFHTALNVCMCLFVCMSLCASVYIDVV